MTLLASTMLSLFIGRADYVAVGKGSGFEPECSAITVERLEREHLAGEKCLGFYLLDANSMCRCTAVDFDNKNDDPDPRWKEKAEQTYYFLTRAGLRPLVEISQSGSGCHIWLFFSAPTPAWIPRAWWRGVSNQIDVKYKETYPRQDVHVGKGLGNLIRYPIWNMSSFVDVEDDWKLCDPTTEMQQAQRLDGSDLKLLAFQLGMGELAADPRGEVIDVGDTGALISLRVQKLVADERSLLGRRWRNDPIGMNDKSRSAVAMSLCCELVRSYVPTPEMAAALRAWCRMHGADAKGDRDSWINLTVSKAYDFVVTKRETRSVSVSTFRDACHAYVDKLESQENFHVPSGITELDDSIDGIAPGEVCVLAGRPGHGKSAVGFQWLASAAELGVSSLIISEEMGHLEIGKRRLLSIASLPQEMWVAASAASLRKDIDQYHKNRADVYVVESSNTIDRAEEVIDQFAQLYNVGLVMVDYLQLLGARTKDRYEVVTEVSRRIKQAARRNNIAILLLSQLNREVEKRDDNDPKMSDLRESGQIEQDADLILFTQYPCKFDHNAPKDQYRIVCAKRRNGPIRQARVETRFDPGRQVIGMNIPRELLDL